MNEFEVGQMVEFRCKDGVEFKGRLLDFTDSYFTIRVSGRARPGPMPATGVLGFPFEMVQMMWAV